IRLASIVVLVFHFYEVSHPVITKLGYDVTLIDRILEPINRSGLLKGPYSTKAIVFGLLVISLIGAKVKRDEYFNVRNTILIALIGCVLFFLGHWIFEVNFDLLYQSVVYLIVTTVGYLLILAAGTWI